LDVFPWQTNVAQKMCQRYLSLGSWIDRMTALAEYYDVPIGHIDGDQPLLLSDVIFSRRLISQDMVLWWSPSGRPDLGGLEDDTRLVEELPNTEFITPGCYSNVSLEVTARNLSVNLSVKFVLHAMVVHKLE
jgi:DNA polymerase epsilon subunit 1